MGGPAPLPPPPPPPHPLPPPSPAPPQPPPRAWPRTAPASSIGQFRAGAPAALGIR
jgi:hypothetical protein